MKTEDRRKKILKRNPLPITPKDTAAATACQDDVDYDKSPKVRKTRAGDIEVTAYLDAHNDYPIELTISATPANWEHIERYIDEDTDEFFWDFRMEFIALALGQVRTSEKRKLRGKHKRVGKLVALLKEKSGMRYALFKYWLRRPEKEWPEYFIKLVRMSEVKDRRGAIASFKRIKQGGRFILTGLTRCSIIASYGREIQEAGLKIDERQQDSFYITYIADGCGASKYKAFFKNKSPNEIGRYELISLKD